MPGPQPPALLPPRRAVQALLGQPLPGVQLPLQGIVRRVEGTKRPCRLAPDGIAAIDQWLTMLRTVLSQNYDRLDEVLAAMEAPEPRKETP